MEFVACTIFLAGLAGCGGQHLTLDAAQAAAASVSGAGQQEPALKATDETWSRVGTEGQWLTVPANTTVRYGASGAYVYKVVSGTFPATNAFFGHDPLRGVLKAVDRLDDTTATTAPTTPAVTAFAPAPTPVAAAAAAAAAAAITTLPAGAAMPTAAAGSPVAPAISGVSGLLQHAAAVIIRGSGFGAGKTTPLVWDDFEGGQDGAPIASTPAAGGWQPVNPSQSTYTTAHRHSGSKSLHARRSPSSQWANFNVELPDAARFYKSFWFRYNYPAGGRGQTKLSQIHGTYGVGDFNPGLMTGGFSGSWWASYLSLEYNPLFNRANYPAEPAQDTWHHFEAILKQSGAGVGDGSVTIKIDGRVVYRQDSVRTRERAGERWKLATFFTGMTNFGAPTESWIDDVYMSDSWARVELCEAGTYAACTRKTIQLATAWGADGIAIRFNQGGFQPGQTAYLYVVNADGAANASGYPVVIGGQGG